MAREELAGVEQRQPPFKGDAAFFGVSSTPSIITPGRVSITNFSRRYSGKSTTSSVCGLSGT